MPLFLYINSDSTLCCPTLRMMLEILVTISGPCAESHFLQFIDFHSNTFTDMVIQYGNHTCAHLHKAYTVYYTMPPQV